MYALLVMVCLFGHCNEDGSHVYGSLSDCVEAMWAADRAVKDHSIVSFSCQRVDDK